MIKLFGLLKSYKRSIIFVFILVFFQSISELYLPTLMSDIVDIGIVKGDSNYILRVGVIMLVVATMGTVAAIWSSFLSSRIATGFSKVIRESVFAKVEVFSLSEFDKVGTSSLITRTTNDITQIQQVLIMILRMAIRAPVMSIGGIIMAVSKNAKLSIIIAIVIPIITVIILTVAKKGMPLFKIVQDKLDKLNLVLREYLTGIRVIRAFNRSDYEKQRFNNANHNLTNISIKVNKIMVALMPLMMLVLNLTTVAIIWFGSIRIDNGNMQVGDLMAFIQYVMQIMFSLIMGSIMFVMIPRASVSALRINEVLDIIPEITDKNQVKAIGNKEASVEFKDVSFSYTGAEEDVISNLSFKANSGEITGIIGGTGSGKSTLINLIPRFYDIDNGSILINGIDIREISQQELRNRIGIVPQKALLFTGTISDNIKFGKKDASEEEIEDALKVAQAIEFVSNLEKGLDSVVSQGGNNLSGGQKQRLAIARALVKKPDIYIFDESFSALDFKTSARLRKALKEETVNATVFIVAQRVSTIVDADKIIVLDEGKMMGLGTHQELLKSCEVYREIVASQFSQEELA